MTRGRETESNGSGAGFDRADQGLIDELWETNRRWLAAVILAYKPRGEDLDDLLQEVAMTLVDKIDTIRDAANVKAWLRTVAINAARAAGRSTKYRPVTGVSDTRPDTARLRPDEEAQSGEHVQRIMQCTAELPDTYREPLLLKAVQGMSSREVADILGISPATVDTRISRARRMLRNLVSLNDQRDTEIHTRTPGSVVPA